ncbi:hypothetical protein PSPO01_03112 [Paraphaeosphaeria sporulosa]
MASKQEPHVVAIVSLKDAGDTIRLFTMMSALRDACPSVIDLKVDFLSSGSIFEYFSSEAAEGVSVAHNRGLDFPESFGSADIVKTFFEGELKAFRTPSPTIVFHRMWAPASIAARLLGIRTANFLTVPLHAGVQTIVQCVSLLLMNALTFDQEHLGAAASARGWSVEEPISPFDMTLADVSLLNDHPTFHQDYPQHLSKTMFIDQYIVSEATKALRMDPWDGWNASILASPSICSINKALEMPLLLMVDREQCNPIVAGMPLVSVALQIEQQTNLNNLMDAGSAIRIQQHWHAANIHDAVLEVLSDPSDVAHGRIAAERIWEFIPKEQLPPVKVE